MSLKKILHHSKKALSAIRQKMTDLRTEEKRESFPKAKFPEEKCQRMVVEISLWSAAKVIFLILGLLLLQSIIVELKDIFIIFFFSLFIAAAFNPGVDKLEKHLRFPRPVGVILLYIVVIGVFGFIVGGIVPIIIEQLTDMAGFLKEYLNNFLKNGSQDGFLGSARPYIERYVNELDQKQIIESLQQSLQGLAQNLGNFAGNALGVISSVVNGILNLVLILFLSFFMSVDRDSLGDFFTSLFPKKYEDYIAAKTHSSQKKIGEWVHGQLALFFIIGAFAYVGLSILGVKYALTLAMVAGLAEFVPYVGPVIAFATAAPVAFNDSVSLGFWVIGFYAFLQFVEGNFIVPLVMRKAVGLPPMVTIIALMVGWQFLGIIGMILSVPVASIIAIFVEDFRERKR